MRFLFPSTLHNYWHVHWKKVLSAAKVYCLLAERPSTQMSSYIRYAFSINQTSLTVRWCNKIKTKKEKRKKKAVKEKREWCSQQPCNGSRALRQDTAIKYQLWAGCCSWSHYFLTLWKVGWQMPLTGAGLPQQMPAESCWHTVAGAAHQFTPLPLLGGKGRWPLQPCHLEPANRAKQWEQTQTMGLYPKAVLWAHLPELGLPLLPVKHVYARQR